MNPSTSRIDSLPFDSLRRRISGDVCTDALRRFLAATDGSMFEVIPRAVVYPGSSEDVAETVRFAGAHRLCVHPRGAGSGLCGSALGAGIVLDFTRHMNRLVSLDLKGKRFTCEPGFRLGELEAALIGSGLFFPPDPSSGEYATFGGMFGTNASGAHSVKYGNVADYLTDAEIVTAHSEKVRLSEIMGQPEAHLEAPFRQLADLYTENAEAIESAYPDTAFNTAGYNLRGMVREGRLDLRRLFCGAEGTLGVATELTFRLLRKPTHDSLVVAFMGDIVSSARAVERLLPTGPSGIEIMDKSLLRLAAEEDPRLKKALPEDVDNVLLMEWDGFDGETVREKASEAERMLKVEGFTDRVYAALDPSEKARFWAVRKAAVPILYRLKGKKKIVALIEDAAVPVDRLVPYFEGVYDLLNRHGVRFVVYGHIAKGLLHTRPLLDLRDPGDVALLKILADAFYDLVSGLGGSVSGEHGDGRIRSTYLRRRYPAIHPLFLEVKHLLDPFGRFNPEIITHDDPFQMQQHLRYGPLYRPRSIGAHQLRWGDAFEDAVELCHGCAKCTTVTTATRMCPVYKATRDERAAPRAKANALRALVSGSLPERALFEKTLQEVMERCVFCESCRWECPSGVDIPKLAMEAKARYVKRFGADLHSRIVTRPETAARVSRKFSRWVDPVLSNPVVKKMGERVTGISAERPPVAFAQRSLFERAAGTLPGKGDTLVYFAGCDAAYIRPEIGEAAIRLLSHLGWRVLLPPQHCCGLPMMAKGMAAGAGRRILANLRKWWHLAADAAAVVVTCSSCGLALMDTWAHMVADERSALLREKVVHWSRLVLPRLKDLPLKEETGRCRYHLPCHLKVQPEAEASLALLRMVPGMTVDFEELGCCGMAGSWGLNRKNETLSRLIGERLQKKLADPGTDFGATDCPTCRMQMAWLGERPVFHPVEILARRLLSGTSR